MILPDNCPLLKGTLYGRGHKRAEGEYVTPAQYQERLESLQAQHIDQLRQLNELVGAKRELMHELEQMIPGSDYAQLEAGVALAGQQVQEISTHVLNTEGAILETQKWMQQMEALLTKHAEHKRQVDEAVGAKRIVMKTLESMLPGIAHEKLEERKKRLDGALAENRSAVHSMVGRIKEALYWIHQTPEGQQPTEAIAQLQALVTKAETIVLAENHHNGHLVDEGDTSVYGSLDEVEMPELVPVN